MAKTFEEAVAVWFGRWIDEYTAKTDRAFHRVTRDSVDWDKPILLHVEGHEGCHYSSYTWESGRTTILIHFTGADGKKGVVEVIDAMEDPARVQTMMVELFQIGFEP